MITIIACPADDAHVVTRVKKREKPVAGRVFFSRPFGGLHAATSSSSSSSSSRRSLSRFSRYRGEGTTEKEK